jgi:putative addiction module killer protein
VLSTNYVSRVLELRKTPEFEKWMKGLKNPDVRSRIQIRLDRLADGNPGDHRPTREGVIEMRLDFGPGYRIYYCKRGEVIVIILGGGTKKTLDNIRSRTTLYDSADYLKSPRDVTAYLEAALEDGDPR